MLKKRKEELGSGRITTPLPQRRAILDEQERDGDHDDRYTAQERARPTRVECSEHLTSEQWERGAEDGSDDGVGRERRGCFVQVGVDYVVQE